MRRRGAMLVLLAVALAARAEPYKLSVYYAGPPAVAKEIEQSFESFRGDVMTVVRFVAETPAEMEAVATAADVVWGGSEPLHRRLRAANRVRPYRSSELAGLDASYWKTAPASAVSGLECTVIAYDPGRLSGGAVPARWRDLLEPRWRGRIAMRNPAASSDSLASASAIVRSFEWSFFESLAVQRPLITSGNEEALSKLASGEALAAIVPYHVLTEARASLAAVWPVDGSITVPRPVAILEQAKRPPMMSGLAEQLVDFVLSLEGQAIGRRHGLYPTRPDVPPPPGAPTAVLPAGGETAWVEAQLGEVRERLRRLFGGR